MVQLTLHASKGNNLKFFPHQGYLGLTPVRVDGAVRVRLENDKPVSARSLTVAVRCYEARVGRFGASSPSRCIAEFSQTLWTGAGGPVERPSSSRSRPSTAAIAANASANAGAAVYADLYDHEASFRITIPTHAPGHSMATYPDYKVYWRVEAVLEHVHIPGVGSRLVKSHDLPLVRHDVPPPLLRTIGLSTPQSSNSPSSSSSSLPLQQRWYTISKGRFPILRYGLSVPSEPIGPEDLVSVPITITPYEASLTIKSVHIAVERRMDFLAGSASGSSSRPDTATSMPDTNSTSPYQAAELACSSGSGTITPTPSTLSRAFSSMTEVSTVGSATPVASQASVLPTPSPSFMSSSSVSLPSNSNASTSTAVNSTGYLLNRHANLPSTPGSAPATSSSTSSSSSSSSRSSSTSTSTISSTITSADISGSLFTRSSPYGSSSSSSASASALSLHEPDIFTKTLALSWPAVRSSSRWSVGETMRTDTVAVRYVLVVKITVSNATTNGGTMTETYELDAPESERELLVVGTNEAQRRLAADRYAEAQFAAGSRKGQSKSKSQSPGRTEKEKKKRSTGQDGESQERGRERTMAEASLPSPPSSPPQKTPALGGRQHSSSSASSASSASSSHSNSNSNPFMRSENNDSQPRTFPMAPPPLPMSAPLIGNSNGGSSSKWMIGMEMGMGMGMIGKKEKSGGVGKPSLRRPHTSAGHPSSSMRGLPSSSPPYGAHGSAMGLGLAPGGVLANGGTAPNAFNSIDSGSGTFNPRRSTLASPDAVAAWEEELARMESKSRRGSALMSGLKGMLKGSVGKAA